MSITLDQSRQIIAAALEAGHQQGFKPLTVVVLDAGAHLVAVEREDGASIKRFEVAHGKAHGALALGMGSRALMARAEQQAYFIATVAAAAGPLIPVPGGVLVKDDTGAVIGAVGVSGDNSDNDETAALAGIQAAGLVAQPD